MDVGFIGLGQMGAAMAANVLAAGHALTVYNRTADRAAPLVSRGARVAPDPAGASRGDVVITMLADDAALHAVTAGERGVLAALRPGAIHVSMSTIGVATSARLAEAHAARGQRYVAAPVFGRPEAAAAAKLFVVAAGESAALDTCEPLFAAMGQRTFRLGERATDANLLKLSGNFLIAAVIESLGEVIALHRKAGLDPAQVLDVLTSTLFGAPVYKNYGALLVEERFSPAGFAAPLGLKDVRLTLAAAESLQVPMPLASLVRDRFLALPAQGGAELDWSAIGRLAAQDAGLSERER